MIVIAEPAVADTVAAHLEREGERVVRIGEVVTAPDGAPRVAFDGRLDLTW
jgi:hypothetical protein